MPIYIPKVSYNISFNISATKSKKKKKRAATFATLASVETKIKVMRASVGQDNLEFTALISLMSVFPIVAKTEASALIWSTFTPSHAFKDLMELLVYSTLISAYLIRAAVEPPVWINAYNCIYSLGCIGNDYEIDIDDCEPNPCKNGGKCIDVVNKYSCH